MGFYIFLLYSSLFFPAYATILVGSEHIPKIKTCPVCIDQGVIDRAKYLQSNDLYVNMPTRNISNCSNRVPQMECSTTCFSLKLLQDSEHFIGRYDSCVSNTMFNLRNVTEFVKVPLGKGILSAIQFSRPRVLFEEEIHPELEDKAQFYFNIAIIAVLVLVLAGTIYGCFYELKRRHRIKQLQPNNVIGELEMAHNGNVVETRDDTNMENNESAPENIIMKSKWFLVSVTTFEYASNKPMEENVEFDDTRTLNTTISTDETF